MGIITINENNFLDKIKGKTPLFTCVISSIETTLSIPISGVHRDVIKYTPSADVELVFYGKSLTLKTPPIDATGSPTPATITRACVELKNIKNLHIDAGAFVKPKIPFIEVDEKPTGKIEEGKAMNNSKELYMKGYLLGKNLDAEMLIVGESVPGGTTTALGVLLGLGYDAEGKVSSGSINNPHELKIKVVREGLKKANINENSSVFDVLNAVGDKMMPVVAGLAISFAEKNKPVILAGGTQMSAVLAVIKEINKEVLDKNLIAIGTTEFVLNDRKGDLKGIVEQIGEVPILASKFYFEKAKIEGLKNYCKGSVKEGVGAGGVAVYSIANGLEPAKIREFIENKFNEWYKK
ncbi:Nicotinate-nucleotide-dimethylbenzimidazole phosphoribosyltransferase [Methanocaldococcus sp. FS406-22]|uniref:nicotinate mononucleotide-dependent phosphoribosyltransferase CobT n=1 Tax=Methanocaldococcus sp. (strain FS406-22) TaxID=644281 RepID=UPI0001BF5010|nr:TIGR00303 family protein [Methanocaldococcus sp. FS406-22]ADC69151.1 Nicotinate-nucleotide-dimethylbenzimidazole phosphoribosyltransferase [Methanocaldococcus sp. FS406-22]